MSPHFVIFQDEEDCWCAATPGFQNIFLDPVGRGHTPREAVEALKGHPGFQERAREFGWPVPTLADFVLIAGPESHIENVGGVPRGRGPIRRRRFKVITR